MKDLALRRKEAEDRFDALAKQREQKQNEMTEIDAELNRLQGEYRLINEIEAEQAEPPAGQDADKKAVSPDPATVDVDKATEPKSNG